MDRIARGCLLLVLLAVVLSGGETEAQQTTPPASFVPVDCWFKHPTKYQVACGHLIVPENRARGDGQTIRLPVVIIPTTSKTPFKDPVLFIGGGPGEPVGLDEEGMKRWWVQLDKSWALQRHGLILFDQRGVGRAEPNLDCPEFEGADIGILKSGADEGRARALLMDAAMACRDRLVAEGHDLASYTTAASAADIADLRRTLGIEQWTLFGMSYGTRLALAVMRDHPEGIRSVILDSVYPPEVYAFQEGPLLVPQALARLFDDCAADDTCRQRVPDMARRFRDLVTRLDAEPLLVTHSHPFSKEPVTIPVTGTVVTQFLFELALYADLYRGLPFWLDKADQGERGALESAAEFVLAAWAMDTSDHGAFLSVECADEYPLNDPALILENRQRVAPFGEAGYYGAWYDLCAIWGAQPATPKSKAPVTSDIPTLLLAGEFDSRTPPEWAKLAAAHLTNGYLAEIAGVGHDLLDNSMCGRMTIDRFLANPDRDPRQSCPPWERSLRTP